MNPMTVIHLISHNHWDREWIFTARYVNTWLVPFFENLFKMLQSYSGYRFVLDGQTLMIEDYLNQLPESARKAQEEKIRKYVKSGRLLIGPAYLQPDWGLVSGEALVRNFLIGHRMARRLGGVMPVAWMLDNFGQIAQAPQICRGFEIEGAFVWRGPELPPQEIKTEFWWESPDGSKILAIYLINSYRNAMTLALTREIARERILSQVQALLPLATTPNVLLMNGYEQVPWPDDILPILETLNRELEEMEPQMKCIQSTPTEYLEAIRRCNPDLPTLQDYFYSGKYAPILKGVFSSRMPLKLQNYICQQELERWAEPFATWAWLLGSPYPQNKLAEAWKTLLLNHTHDDICGCCIDPIARDMQDRFVQVHNTVTHLTEESLSTITQFIDTRKDNCTLALVVFNPSCHPRTEVLGLNIHLPRQIKSFSIINAQGKLVPYQMIKREEEYAQLYLLTEEVPSLGYKTFYLKPAGFNNEVSAKVHASEKDGTLENEWLKVQIQPNGSLTLTSKKTGKIYENLGYFEDGGDCGDTYDYSPPPRDVLITSLQEKAKITLELSGPLLARFRVQLTLNLPESLTKDRKRRKHKTRAFHVINYVQLRAHSPWVEVTTVFNNVVKDHRLRILFPTSIQAQYCCAGEPFDLAHFSLSSEEIHEEMPEKLKQLMLAGKYTVPVKTRVFQHFVSLQDEEKGLAILTSGLTEHEILQKNTIALTLLRSVGWLARADLPIRQGDVGPQIFTPEAQCLGAHTFSYAIYPYSGAQKETQIPKEAENHNLKLKAVQTVPRTGVLTGESSLIRWESQRPNHAFIMTALKQAEDGEGVIFRFFNACNQKASGELKIWPGAVKVFKVKLNEQIQEELDIKNGMVQVEARAKEIVTLKIVSKQNRDLKKHPTRTTAWILHSPIFEKKLPKVPQPPVITLQELQAEEKRARTLKEELERIKQKVQELEARVASSTDKAIPLLAKLQRMKAGMATLKRQYFEAHISVLLNRQLYTEQEIDRELREIGEEYCIARTIKRVNDFLCHYYEHLVGELNP
ncbi:MAG: hypothetical protein D6813_05230 [Calditrichaeota bacterium]|nr:MAG: hypothetical protein D6813_05230 [Calditrichota bacterium]